MNPSPQLPQIPGGRETLEETKNGVTANGESAPNRVLRCIIIECLLPQIFEDDLTLILMRKDTTETFSLARNSPIRWKVDEDIQLPPNSDDMTLVVHSEDGGDEAFLTFSADNIQAMASAALAENEGDTLLEHEFSSAKDGNLTPCKMISILSVGPASNPANRMSQSALGNSIGFSYYIEFQRSHNLQNINLAISYLQTTVDITPTDDIHFPEYCNNLGNSYYSRFLYAGDLQDIGRAILYHRKAVESTTSSNSDFAGFCTSLGNSYLRRFERLGGFHDVDCAITHHRNAVNATPNLHHDRAFRLNGLANAYARRSERTGNLQDTDCSISHYQSAVDSTSSDSKNFPTWLSNLGNAYFLRFKRTGDIHDIESAVSNHLRCVNSTPSGDPDLPNWLSNLGSSYSTRFQCIGNLKDIDLSISHLQNAVQLFPSDHRNLPGTLSNLGSSYFTRFNRTNDLHDINRAIFYHEKAVDIAPHGHANLPRWLNSLGASYSGRYEHTQDPFDLDHAVSRHKSAVESAPSNHAQLPGWLGNLGAAYLSRYRRFNNPQDLDQCISCEERAVRAIPSGHANQPAVFHNLGISYLHRFESRKDPEDINLAISHHETAVRLTPSGHASLSTYRQALANAHFIRSKHTSNSSDLETAIDMYRQSAEANGKPSTRLRSASIAAELSSASNPSRSLIDYGLAISLLSEVVGLEQTVYRRHATLQSDGYRDLVGSAVAVALSLERLDLALEWLEEGRCLVWNQIHQLRTPIDSLRKKNPELAKRFVKAARALESDGTRASLPTTNHHTLTLADDIHAQNGTRDHTIHASDYKEVLNEVRSLPGFDTFLRPPKVCDLLSSIPPDGPVIIFNIHKTRCDALALMAGLNDPLHICLPDFSFEQALQMVKELQVNVLRHREVGEEEVEPDDRATPRRSAFRRRPSMASILKELWCKVVQPVLEALGFSLGLPPASSERSRLWWCPTGPLAFLPLHAAGIYGSEYKPGSSVSDFVVSSYIPMVRTLTQKFAASSTYHNSTNLVLVSQPKTPGLPEIPFTREETRGIDALMKGTGVYVLMLEDSDATKENVGEAIKTGSWIHFAYHGVQDVEHPLKSGLCIHDGRVELLDIMKQKIPSPDMAFLSACQTSKGEPTLSEEVVHLTAGLLAAGYRGVVGTMWSISDLHGPEFAMEFYLYLLKEQESKGLNSTRAAYALDHATRKVRESLSDKEPSFLTWVPYVHFGY